MKPPIETAPDDITIHPKALVVPPSRFEPNRAMQASGVFASDGQFVENCVTQRPSGRFFNSPPEMPEDAEIHELGGTHIFMGPFFGHFGHMLIDSLARIWALEHVGRADGVIFTPKANNKNTERIVNVYLPLMRELGLTFPIINTRIPMRVDRLIVPPQGVGLEAWNSGSPAFRAYMRTRGGKNVAPKGAKKLYISRSALPLGRSSILAEKRLEAYLEAEGYDIFHPQNASQEEQIARYRAAEYVIAPDGSALHLLAYVGSADQKIAIIARRSTSISVHIEAQLRDFNDCLAVTLNCLKEDWLPARNGTPNRLSWGEVDFPSLAGELKDRGFISGSARWTMTPDTEIAAEIVKIEEVEKTPFKAWRRSA